MSPLLKARLQVLAAALLFSTGGPLIKASTLTPWQIACFRSTIAACVVLVAMPAARRALGRESFLVGLAFGATMVLYVLANRATTAANAIFLQSTAPLYVMVLAPWLLRERARARDLLVVAGLAAGVALILFSGEAASATAPDPVRGNLLGTGAGFSWALTVLGLRWLGRGGGAGVGDRGSAAIAAGNVLAAAVALPIALASSSLLAFGLRDLLIVSYLGAGQIVLAYVFLNRGLRRLPAFEASLLLLLEPVASTALGALVHGERPGLLSFMGAGLILAATALKTWLDRGDQASAQAAEPDDLAGMKSDSPEARHATHRPAP